MRVVRYRLRRGSGGHGLARSGDGIERDLQRLADVAVSLITERRVSQPWGLDGGGPAPPRENWLLLGGDESQAEQLLDKCTFSGEGWRRPAHADARRWGLGEQPPVVERRRGPDRRETIDLVRFERGEP